MALSIKTKLDKIKVNCHEITINEKTVPPLKTSDPTIKAADRPDYWRIITTSSRSHQSNSIIKRSATEMCSLT